MDPETLKQIQQLLQGTLAGAAGLRSLQWVFGLKGGDIPVCHTRITREKLGLPWNKLITVHPLADGYHVMEAVEEKKPKK